MVIIYYIFYPGFFYLSTCQTLYFQMYKDLQLSLENIEAREKEKRGIIVFYSFQFFCIIWMQSRANAWLGMRSNFLDKLRHIFHLQRFGEEVFNFFVSHSEL